MDLRLMADRPTPTEPLALASIRATYESAEASNSDSENQFGMNGILFSINPNTSIMVLNTLVLLGECPIALEHGRNDTKIANLLIRSRSTFR